jgi:ubiquinol-cytochrome c reductase cytochrome c1 subunit
MMSFFNTLGLTGAVVALWFAPAFANEGQRDAKGISYSFEGPFGTFDRAQLQRGYKVYKEVCSTCHAMHLVSFRNLSEPGGPEFTEGQVKALAETFTVKDGPDANGEMFDRPARPSDRFVSPYPNEEAARASNGGALPPDLSLITKGRAGWYGTFNQLINGVGGPQYVYSVLTGYEEPNEELQKEQPEGKYYNSYFANGHWIAMPPPLADGLVTFDDEAKNSTEDMARDVSAFLAWSAEPKMEERKRTGLMVLIYLGVFATLLYLVKQKVWRDVEH